MVPTDHSTHTALASQHSSTIQQITTSGKLEKKPHVSNLVGQMCFLLLVRHSNWVNLLLDEFHCIGEFHSGVPFGSPYLGDLWNSKLWKSMKTNTLQNHGISLPEIYHQV